MSSNNTNDNNNKKDSAQTNNRNLNLFGQSASLWGNVSEASIHLRDLFGSTYSFADDPSELLTAPPNNGNGGDDGIGASERSAVSTSASGRRSRSPHRRSHTASKVTAQPIPTFGKADLKSLRKRGYKSNSPSRIGRVTSVGSVNAATDRENANTHGGDTANILAQDEFASMHLPANGGLENAGIDLLLDEDLSDNKKTRNKDNKDLGSEQNASQNSDQNSNLNQSVQSIFQDEYQSSAAAGESSERPGKNFLSVIHTNNASKNNNLLNNSDEDVDLIKKSRRFKTKESPRERIILALSLVALALLVWFVSNFVSIWVWNPEPPTFEDIIMAATEAPMGVAEPEYQLTLDDLGDIPEDTKISISAFAKILRDNQKTLNTTSPEEQLKLTSNAPGMAFGWLQGDPHLGKYSQERKLQRFALATLYFATNPPSKHTWKNSGHWLSYDHSECLWHMSASTGYRPELDLCTVMTDTTLQNHKNNLRRRLVDPRQQNDDAAATQSLFLPIRSLPLQNNNLVGELPTTELSVLSHLDYIRFNGNPGLTGRLPEPFCQATTLQIDCSSPDELVRGVCGCGCPCQ